MTRDELLDKLAMELGEWPSEAGQHDDFFFIPRSQYYGPGAGGVVTPLGFTKEKWQARRTQLINKPSWKGAPERANYLCQNEDGRWCWMIGKPRSKSAGYWVCRDGGSFASQGDIPAGHNWRDTLEQRPVEAYDEERMDAVGQNGATGEHYEEAPTVKQRRYLDATGDDWIDQFARTATIEEFRGAMRFTIGKYNQRVGKKDEITKEIEKMRDYCERWLAVEAAHNANNQES